MTELLSATITEFHKNSLLELVAVAFAVVYLLLATRQLISCWYAAFISSAIFLFVFWQVNLFMECGLQLYYLGMAIYGWWSWKTQKADSNRALKISTWPLRKHFIVISAILVATGASGTLLYATEQRLGYLDSFTTWGALVATFMVTKKILENWLYWIIVDCASLYLYFDRELYFTVVLFTLYLVIIFFGFRIWLKEYRLSLKNMPAQRL